MVRISPMSFCSPTRTTSDIFASASPVATTSGPETFVTIPMLSGFLSSEFRFKTQPLRPDSRGHRIGNYSLKYI